MRAYLHIGTPKTATTTLQAFLQTNRETLLKSGYIYTKAAGEINNCNLAVAALNDERRNGLTRLLGITNSNELIQLRAEVILSLKKEIENLSDKTGESRALIFSSEYYHLHLIAREERERLKSILAEIGVTDIRIVVYLRNPADLANSYFSTSVKAGGTATCPPSPKQERYNLLCNHRQTLKNFASVFGEENIIPRLFDRDEFVNNSIIDDFLHVVGKESYSSDCILAKNSNVSISSDGTELLSRLNQIFPRWLGDDLNILQLRATDYIEKSFSDGDYRMPVELYEQYNKEFSDSNEWVRENYFPEKVKLFKSKKNISVSSVDQPEQYWKEETHKIATKILKEARSGVVDESCVDLEKYGLFNQSPKSVCSLNLAFGVGWFNIEEYDQALGVLDLVLASDSTNEIALLYKAKCLSGLSKNKAAEICFEKVLKTGNGEALKPYARHLLKIEDFDKAETILIKVQEADCEDLWGFAEHADIPARQNRWKESAQRWKKISELFPDSDLVKQKTAYSLLMSDDYTSASALYENILKKKKLDKDSLLGLARCEIKSGKIENAEQILLEAQVAHPDFYPVFNEYAYLAKNHKESAERWRSLSELFPHNSSCFFQSAVSYANAGELQFAIDILNDLLKFDPKNDRAINLLSTFYYQSAVSFHALGDLENSLRILNFLLDRKPGHIQARLFIGRVIVKLVAEMVKEKKYDQALEKLEHLLRIDPNNQQAIKLTERTYYQFAVSCIRSKDYFEAVSSLKRLLSINSENSQGSALLQSVYYHQARDYKRVGDIKECTRFINILIELNPSHEQGLALLRKIVFEDVTECFRTGKFDDAIKVLEHYINTVPDNDQAKSFLQRAYYQSAVSSVSSGMLCYAQNTLLKFIEIDSKHKQGISLLKKVYLQKAIRSYNEGELSICLEKLTTLLDIDPKHERGIALYRTASTRSASEFYERGKYKLAITRLEEVDKVVPLHRQGRSLLQRSYFLAARQALTTGGTQDAIKQLEKLVELDPDHRQGNSLLERCYYNSAAKYYAEKDIRYGLIAIEKYLDMEPYNKDGLLLKAKLFSLEYDYKNAELVLEHLNKNHDGFVPGLIECALIASAQRNWEEAECRWKKVIQLAPNLPIGHYNIGLVNMETKQYSRASADFGRLLKLDKDHLAGMRYKAICLEEMKCFHEAEILYLEVLNRSPDLFGMHAGYSALPAKQHNWQLEYKRAGLGDMDNLLIKRLKELEDENHRLKKMYAEEKLKADLRDEALREKSGETV